MSEQVPSHESSHREDDATSQGNGLGLTIVLFIVLFGLFALGLYTMSLFTPVFFVAGLVMCLVALFGTFAVVPKFLT